MLVKPNEAFWCGAARMHEMRRIRHRCELYGAGPNLVEHPVDAMAPAGSKIIVAGRFFAVVGRHVQDVPNSLVC